MKKIFLSVSILFLVAVFSGLYAQGIGVGIKAGVNFSNQSVKDLGNNIGNLSTEGCGVAA